VRLCRRRALDKQPKVARFRAGPLRSIGCELDLD
jgi:hypothetical protein